MNLSNVVKYYQGCVREEARISAFSNIKNDKNTTIIKVHGKEQLGLSYPNPVFFQDIQSILTEVMIKSELDKTKQLVYGYLFFTGRINTKDIYAPLLFTNIELERLNGRVYTSLAQPSFQLNASILAELFDKDKIESIIKILTDEAPTFPLTADSIDNFLKVLRDLKPNGVYWNDNVDENAATSLKITREKAILLANVPKDFGGLLKELSTIAENCDDIDNRSVLNTITTPVQKNLEPVCCIEDTLELFYPEKEEFTLCSATCLSKSQEEVILKGQNSIITPVIGGPGTGKSNVIVGLATHLVANGKTVLIASKLNSAVDVVKDRLDRLGRPERINMPVFSVRTGSKNYRNDLAELIDNIVSGKTYAKATKVCSRFDKDLNESLYTLQDLYEVVSQREYAKQQIAKFEQNIVDGTYKSHLPLIGGFLSSIARKKIVDLRENEIKILNDLNDELSDYDWFKSEGSLNAHLMAVKALNNILITKIEDKLQNNPVMKQRMITLCKQLKSGRVDSHEYSRNFKSLIESILPCWLTTTNEVSSSIPLEAGLFDYVIIDEASQCDIASCVPLLYRAKHAIIVGDDKQLKYLSFMNKIANYSLLNECEIFEDTDKLNLDYRVNSMFDFAKYYSEIEPLMLKEHYRSYDRIIGFSNKKFYGDLLICKKEYPDNMLESCVQVKQINNATTESKKTCNTTEARQIIKDIQDDIERQKERGDMPKTIGIVTPFKAQVDLLNKMIASTISLQDIKTYEIVVGTAHTFQGGERDHIYISWTVAPNSHVQSYTFINNPNLFNVTITRARDKVINYVSNDIKGMPNGLLKEYLSYITT